jgi:hypothetical protein
MDLRLGDIVRLRKKHPCGGNEWQVTRLGADIRIKCVTCQRQVMLGRSIFERRIKALISRNNPAKELKEARPLE